MPSTLPKEWPVSGDGVFVRDPALEHALPKWGVWSELVAAGALPAELGFTCEQARLNRLNARYRVARSFRGIALERFGPTTIDGYTALFRLFLTWTAFEQYYTGLGLTAASRDAWFAPYLPPDIDARVRKLDPGNRLFNLVVSKTKGDVQRHVDAYRRGAAYGFTYLPAALRHLFAHGILTPHANNADPGLVKELSNLLAEALLSGLASDFPDRVEQAVAARAA
jgi:hypothetical protein